MLNKFFSDCRYVPQLQRYSPTKLCDGAQMAHLWRFFASCISASRVQYISNLHSKFAQRPHHVWKYGRHPVCDRCDQARKKKKKGDRKKKETGQKHNVLMCGSMVGIQSATAVIRRGKKRRKEKERRKKQDKSIMSSSATQRGHNKNTITSVYLFDLYR